MWMILFKMVTLESLLMNLSLWGDIVKYSMYAIYSMNSTCGWFGNIDLSWHINIFTIYMCIAWNSKFHSITRKYGFSRLFYLHHGCLDEPVRCFSIYFMERGFECLVQTFRFIEICLCRETIIRLDSYGIFHCV